MGQAAAEEEQNQKPSSRRVLRPVLAAHQGIAGYAVWLARGKICKSVPGEEVGEAEALLWFVPPVDVLLC